MIKVLLVVFISLSSSPVFSNEDVFNRICSRASELSGSALVTITHSDDGDKPEFSSFNRNELTPNIYSVRVPGITSDSSFVYIELDGESKIFKPKIDVYYGSSDLMRDFHQDYPFDNNLPVFWFEDIELIDWKPTNRRYGIEIEMQKIDYPEPLITLRTLTEKCDRVDSVLHCTTTKDVYVIKNLRNRRNNTEYC